MRTYLVTYSLADLTNFPTRKGFGKCIKKHFNSGSGKVKVQHWACAKEKHQNGGVHYHVALKLTGPKHWKSVKERIPLKEGIVVNFSGNHDNYYSAYRYIYKDDDSVHHSKHHPNLDDVALPWTKSQPKPTNKLKNHMPRKTQLTLHKNEAESKMQEMSNSI